MNASIPYSQPHERGVVSEETGKPKRFIVDDSILTDFPRLRQFIDVNSDGQGLVEITNARTMEQDQVEITIREKP